MDLGNMNGAASAASQNPEGGTHQTQAPAGSERNTQGGFDLANRMAELMRRERDLQQKESQWKSNADRLKRLEQLDSAKSIDDKLSAIGLDYSKITQHYLNKSDNDHVEELKRRLEEVEGRANQAYEQLSQRQIQEMQQQGMKDIDAFLQESEEFPLIKALGEQDTIWHMVTGHYQKTGEPMTYADAAKLIEGELQKKLGGLKSHKDADWFKQTLGFDDESDRQTGSDKPADTDRFTGGQPAIVHNMLNAQRGNQPSSLGAIESGSASRAQGPKSDAQARAEAFELLKKLRQG